MGKEKGRKLKFSNKPLSDQEESVAGKGWSSDYIREKKLCVEAIHNAENTQCLYDLYYEQKLERKRIIRIELYSGQGQKISEAWSQRIKMYLINLDETADNSAEKIFSDLLVRLDIDPVDDIEFTVKYEPLIKVKEKWYFSVIHAHKVYGETVEYQATKGKEKYLYKDGIYYHNAINEKTALNPKTETFTTESHMAANCIMELVKAHFPQI